MRTLGILGLALVSSFGAAATLAWSGCGEPGVILGTCPEGATQECCPCSLPEDCPDGEPPIPTYCDGGLDTRKDAGSGFSSEPLTHCPEKCIPQAPPSWTGPELVYQGAKIFAPTCPEAAPNVAFEGVTGPDALPRSCPGCVCDPPSGTCKLPTTWTISSAPCSDPMGGVKTNFDPPAGWDGACIADDVIPAGKLCGGKPCVASITVSAPVVEETPCAPHSLEPLPEVAKLFEDIPFPEDTIGRSCAPTMPWPGCQEEPNKLCLPKRDSSFAVCIYKEGDEACPEGWPEHSFYYGGVDDQRGCPPCGCEPSTGASCLAQFTVAGDVACSLMPFSSGVSTSMPLGCTDLPLGTALGSKSSTIVSYTPGTCKPTGGTLTGALSLSKPTTFCCLPKG